VNDPTVHDTVWYPGVPVVQDIANNDLALFSDTDLIGFGQAAGVTFDPMKGDVLLQVHDCNGTPLAGATVSTNPAGTSKVVYFSSMTPNMTADMTDPVAFVLIANLDPVYTMLTGKVDGMDLRSHSFMVNKDALVQTLIQP
jgi:hypothetical protein